MEISSPSLFYWCRLFEIDLLKLKFWASLTRNHQWPWNTSTRHFTIFKSHFSNAVIFRRSSFDDGFLFMKFSALYSNTILQMSLFWLFRSSVFWSDFKSSGHQFSSWLRSVQSHTKLFINAFLVFMLIKLAVKRFLFFRERLFFLCYFR